MGYLAQNFTNTPVDLAEVLQECKRISQIIVQAIQPEKIVLFGSAADGTFKASSDLDILIILADETLFKPARYNLAAQKIKPKWECDYLFITLDRYEKMKDVGGPIYMAHNFGKILYDQRAVV